MNSKLFISTFILIFLAELGDKTQLAAMARAATGGDAKWTVFFAASSALVLSTMIAVMLGSVLNRMVPPIVIKLAAGGLFILFGILILINALAPAKAPVSEQPAGVMASFILRVAADFEAAASADYAQLQAGASDPALKQLLQKLADEEQDHYRRLSRIGSDLADARVQEYRPDNVPAPEELTHDVAVDDKPVIRHAIEHELATARFYEEMARVTHIASLKSAFTALAKEEHSHARRLEDFLRTA